MEVPTNSTKTIADRIDSVFVCFIRVVYRDRENTSFPCIFLSKDKQKFLYHHRRRVIPVIQKTFPSISLSAYKILHMWFCLLCELYLYILDKSILSISHKKYLHK